jgi:hypothetical protein
MPTGFCVRWTMQIGGQGPATALRLVALRRAVVRAQAGARLGRPSRPSAVPSTRLTPTAVPSRFSQRARELRAHLALSHATPSRCFPRSWSNGTHGHGRTCRVVIAPDRHKGKDDHAAVQTSSAYRPRAQANRRDMRRTLRCQLREPLDGDAKSARAHPISLSASSSAMELAEP